MLELPGGNILVDTTPEMRVQLLREKIRQVHAILYTHYHADHLFGLDDARLFPRSIGGPVPVYCERTTEDAIRSVFHYAFDDHARKMHALGGGVPQLQFRAIAPGEPFAVLGQEIMPMRLEHGRFQVLGFRVGDLAYCTDVVRIPEASLALLQDLDVLILDALRIEPHPTHFNLEEALAVIARLRPKRAFLTHLSHDMDHSTIEATLPSGVRLAYDGLSLAF